MIKLMFATDFHFRSMRPIARVDENFFEVQLAKLGHLAILSKGMNACLLGGDIFDRPDVGPGVIIKVMRELAKFKCPVYTVIGNHEVYGYEGQSIERSALGVLFEHGCINRLDYLGFPGVHIYGVHAFDKPTWVVPEADEKKIIVAHKMITNNPIPNVDCIMVDALAKVTNADVILSGDIHYPHTVEIGEKLFINTGSVSRMSISDRARLPQAIILTIDGNDVSHKYVKIPAKLGADVFNMADYSAKIEAETHTKDFVKAYASVVFSVKAEAHMIADVLAKFMKDNNVSGNMQGMVNTYYKNAEVQVLKNSKEE